MMKSGNYTFDCALWPDKPNQCKTVLILQRTFSVLSILGCLFVIAVIWLFRKYKYFVQRLIVSLSVSAALQGFSFILGDLYSHDAMCEFQAFIMQYFGWATLLWVLAITVNIILALQSVSGYRYEKWFHLLCWLVPFFWALLPFINDSYGPAGVWCWIKRDATALRFGTWFVPTFAIILFLAGAYFYIIVIVLHQRGSWSGRYNAETEHDNAMLAREVKPLAAFPLIYLVLSLPPLIYRIDDAVHPHLLPNYSILVVSVIFAPSVGALNAIAFAFYSDVQAQLTWPQVKSAFLSHFSSSSTRITHNVDMEDGLTDNEVLA